MGKCYLNICVYVHTATYTDNLQNCHSPAQPSQRAVSPEAGHPGRFGKHALWSGLELCMPLRDSVGDG